MWDLIVIGGGAAGLWGAGTAATRGLSVLVLEKNNKAGVKILISGGTRCNVTHHCDIAGILGAFGKQGRFLKPALHELPPEEVVRVFNGLGVETKVEDTGKVFPVSDRAIDVRDALVNRLQQQNAQLRTGVAVQDIHHDPVSGHFRVQTGDAEFECRQLLLCCGGLSYAGCGTTGDGYAWARKFGHTIVDTRPALTPLLSPAAWVHGLTGITMPDVTAKVVVHGQKDKDPRLTSRGSFLWTHFGCSGPTPMNVSRFVPTSITSDSDAPPPKVELHVDMLPDINEDELHQRLSSDSGGRKQIEGLLGSLVPRQLATHLVQRAGIQGSLTLAELPKKSRMSLVEDLKRLIVPLSGNRGYPKAEVTAGGVDTREVNPHTLESRLVKGLYFAGEILDIDGPIGGFNFQAAFSTSHLACLSMVASEPQS